MIVEIYTYYDRVANSYGDLKLFTKQELAERSFDYELSKAPFGEDIELYKLGTYDIETGVITVLDKPLFIKKFVKKEQ